MCKNCKREYNKARYVAKKRSEASTPTTSFSGMSTPLDMSDNHDVNDTLQQAVHAITRSSDIHASLEDRKEQGDAIANLGVRTEALELQTGNLSERVNTHSRDINASLEDRTKHRDAIGVRTEALELQTGNLSERVNTHSRDINASLEDRTKHRDAIASLGVRTEALELVFDNLNEHVNALKITTAEIRLVLDDIDTRVAAIEGSRTWRLFPVLLAFSAIMALCMRK